MPASSGISPASLSASTFTGGVSSTGAPALKPLELGLGDLSLPELMSWLTTTLQKSDKAIREQMTDINAKKDYAATLSGVLSALTRADNTKLDEAGRECKDLPNLRDYADQPWFRSLDVASQRAYADLCADALGGGDTKAEQSKVKSALTAISNYVGTLNSENETAMIRLQSAISSRSQAIQLVSNMLNSLNETAKSTVGNIR